MARFLGPIFAFLAAAIWGGVYVVSKYVLAVIPPITLVWLRFALASLILGGILFLALRRRPSLGQSLIRRRDLLLVALAGAIGYSLSIIGQFIGTYLSTAANGALVTSAAPAFIVLFAWWFLQEPLTPGRIWGLLLATTGVLVVIDPRIVASEVQAALAAGQNGTEGLSSLVVGDLWLLVAAIAWALFSVLVKKLSRTYDSLTITLFASLCSLPVTGMFVPAELATHPIGTINATIVLGVLYIGIVSTALAAYLWNKSFEMMDAGVASVFFFAQPTVGAFLGYLLLGERLGINFFLGGFLILCGVFVVSRPAVASVSIR
ncbi:MAG: DMT family transporter [Chloroflexi bacterium]|nr:DMT family transporter [Chloroflexota bacterium]